MSRSLTQSEALYRACIELFLDNGAKWESVKSRKNQIVI